MNGCDRARRSVSLLRHATRAWVAGALQTRGNPGFGGCACGMAAVVANFLCHLLAPLGSGFGVSVGPLSTSICNSAQARVHGTRDAVRAGFAPKVSTSAWAAAAHIETFLVAQRNSAGTPRRRTSLVGRFDGVHLPTEVSSGFISKSLTNLRHRRTLTFFDRSPTRTGFSTTLREDDPPPLRFVIFNFLSLVEVCGGREQSEQNPFSPSPCRPASARGNSFRGCFRAASSSFVSCLPTREATQRLSPSSGRCE
jgi:hypothetical protein